MPFNKHSFCPELWSQLEITSTGDYKICCLAYGKYEQGIATDANGQVMNVMTHSILDAINSEANKSIRLAQSRNEMNFEVPQEKSMLISKDFMKVNT